MKIAPLDMAAGPITTHDTLMNEIVVQVGCDGCSSPIAGRNVYSQTSREERDEIREAATIGHELSEVPVRIVTSTGAVILGAEQTCDPRACGTEDTEYAFSELKKITAGAGGIS